MHLDLDLIHPTKVEGMRSIQRKDTETNQVLYRITIVEKAFVVNKAAGRTTLDVCTAVDAENTPSLITDTASKKTQTSVVGLSSCEVESTS